MKNLLYCGNARHILCTVALIALVFLGYSSSRGQKPAVTWSSFSTSFGELSDGNTRARVLAGQAFAGELEGPNISVGSGFFYNPDVSGLESSVSIPLQQGWNLISNPVTREAGEDSTSILFPSATYPYGFAYVPGTGYEQRFTMENRIGYWMKFPDIEIASVYGSPRNVDTISVVKGWNMVGSISLLVDTAMVISDPPGNRLSPWFGYFGSLTPVEQIIPGYAYWVKAETTGVFILGELSHLRNRRIQQNEKVQLKK